MGNVSSGKRFPKESDRLSGRFCGAEGSRTPDLLIANQALFQLSYSPTMSNIIAKIVNSEQ